MVTIRTLLKIIQTIFLSVILAQKPQHFRGEGTVDDKVIDKVNVTKICIHDYNYRSLCCTAYSDSIKSAPDHGT